MAEKTISLSNLTAYNDKIKATYQAKTDNTLTTTNKTVVGAINENKTQLDNIATDLNGYKFVDAPSEGEKDLYMQEFDTGIIQTKEDNKINGEDKNLVNVINSTKASVENHIANHPSGGGSVDHNHINLNILNTITKENRYVTQEEFDALSESDKNNASIVWNVLTQNEVFGLTLDGNNLNLTKNGVVISTVSLSGIGGGDEVVVYGGIVISKTTMDVIEGASDTFTVKLDKAPTNSQTVTLSSNNSDVILTPSELTFNSANYNTPQSVTVSIAEDNSDYSNEVATITISSANVTSKHITVNITDNDEPPVTDGAVSGALIQLDASSFNDSTKYWAKTVGTGSISTSDGAKDGDDVKILKTRSLLIENVSSHSSYTYEVVLRNIWKIDPSSTQIPCGTNTTSEGLGIIFRATGTVECKNFKNNTVTSLLSLSNFSSADYLHVAVVADSSTNTFKLYVNNTPTTNTTLGTLYNINPLRINPLVSNALDVYIRTIRVYPKALTDAEVQQNYDYELSRI